MRNAILQVPDARTVGERRQVIRAAIRQLERAELYLAAVAFMDLNDREAEQAVSRLRQDVNSLQRYLAALRSDIRA